MASQMQQSRSNHRRNPAGQGIVIRPSVGKSECRYCHEEGHHNSKWDPKTRTKVVTCPKLIAKEERKQRRGQRSGGGGRQVSQSSTNNLSGWVTKAEKNGRKQRRFVQNSRPIRHHAPLAVNNLFAALGGAEKNVKVEIRGPKAAVAVAPIGIWGSRSKLHSSIADVMEREEVAEALGLVAKAIVTEAADEKAVGKLVSLAKVPKKVRFAGDTASLMKPPCKIKVFRKEDPPIVVSSDDDDEQPKLAIGKNAWRPKRASQGMTGHERQTILDENRVKKAELEELENDGAWADGEEIDELSKKIADLNARLGFTGGRFM